MKAPKCHAMLYAVDKSGFYVHETQVNIRKFLSCVDPSILVELDQTEWMDEPADFAAYWLERNGNKKVRRFMRNVGIVNTFISGADMTFRMSFYPEETVNWLKKYRPEAYDAIVKDRENE